MCCIACVLITGDKNERRRKQRADKAASAAALLQHAISDDRFAAAVQDLESSFGAKFSDFITGQYVWQHGQLLVMLRASVASCLTYLWCVRLPDTCHVPGLHIA